ncbi:MAG: hypothetical protein COA94_00940 [Rickettsiales bacterium]|nr:MAG: hypothetical protein COA94_00940 [Rickettsiales bacterium]
MIFEYLTNNTHTLWLLLGAIFIVLEVTAITGIGFLFAGLAAISLGGIIQFDLITSNDPVLEIAIFLLLSFVWASILWIPFKRFKHSRTNKPFSNIVGDIAIIESSTLAPGKIGQVKWSGTIMRAALDSKGTAVLTKGDQVVIKALNGNILIVESIN